MKQLRDEVESKKVLSGFQESENISFDSVISCQKSNSLGECIALQFVDKVREIAEELDIDFFVVTDGASSYSNRYNTEAVKHARESHMSWERENNIDSLHNREIT